MIDRCRRAWFAALMLLPLCGVASAADLYRTETYVPLTADTRSFRAGDALTVVIVESSTAESDAASSRSRDFKLTGAVQGTTIRHGAGLSLDRQDDNSGSTDRSGNLQAVITARIQSVAPNGDLSLHGVQSITVNGEAQRIELSGVVRPIDVSSNNVVLSTRISNAVIDYSGKGFVDRSQRQGIISRLFDYLGL